MTSKRLLTIFFSLALFTLPGHAQNTASRAEIEKSYNLWRQAMVSKSARQWQQYTATHRQTELRNRFYSEHAPFPQAIFELPVAPPDVTKLKALSIRVKGPTAKAIYFGKVDFGVGGKPTDNLLVVSFFNERGVWKYDLSEFVNLEALPDVRAAIQKGDNKYIDQADFMPDGLIPRPAVTLNGPVPYIANVYVFSPGREVEVQVNRLSRHLFQNNVASEVVIGGARGGENQVEFKIKNIPGGTGKEALTIRIYLMSEIEGVKPIKAYEYLVQEGEKFTPAAKQTFDVTADMGKQILGR